ncbi:MAG: acyl-CoA dehydrogenase family protein [Pseudomonadota bacterium]
MASLNQSDYELLRDTAGRFFDERSPVDALRALRDEANESGFDRAVWGEMIEMGWGGILIDERHGGIEFGYQAMGELQEQAGRRLVASPLLSTAAICAPLLAAGAKEARARYLAPLLEGNLIGALAIDEHRRHAPQRIATEATPDNGEFILSGQKIFVVDGHIADLILVLAKVGANGMGLFAVEPGFAGVMRTRAKTVDGHSVAEIVFNDVVVPDSHCLSADTQCRVMLERALDGARALLSAEMLGIAQEAFDRTIEYLQVREQFDAPLGSFQALKHRAAQMFCEIELARSAVFGALKALDENDPVAPELCSVAKAKSCEMLELVSNEALQMHGGIGMTDASDIGLFMKRARVAQQLFGDASFHRDRFATLIGL